MSLDASPCERLATSRERLRQALLQAQSGEATGADTQGLLGLLGHLQTGAGEGLGVAMLKAWWQKQPLHVVGLLALKSTQLLVQPVARRHPYALVFTAAAAGAAVMLLRPWRAMSRSAWLSSLLPQLLSEAVKRLAPQLPDPPPK
jgi:hypothetical protein